MRQVALAGILVVLGAGSASAQTVEAKQPWAQKLFQGVNAHDFGTVPRGTQLKCSLRMKNIWAVPIQITDVSVGCNCVTATPSSRVLQPHETGTLDIAMDGRRFTGTKSVTVRVTVGPEYVSTASIRINAVARADVVLNPGEINFGVVASGKTPTQVIDVEYAGNMDWRITEVVKNAAAPINVTPQELYRQPPTGVQAGKVGYRLTVVLKSDATPGSFKHELMLKTNDPASPVLPVVVEGNVQASLAVSPTLVHMGNVKIGQEKSFKVSVRADHPFQIIAVDGQGTGLSAVLPTQPSQVHQLTLKYKPDQPGDLRKVLTIQTDMAPRTVVAVTVEASAVP
jgi:Protein of unknown function (DUF1573)